MVKCPYISRESFNVNSISLKTSFQLVKDNNFKCKCMTDVCLQLLPCSYLQA